MITTGPLAMERRARRDGEVAAPGRHAAVLLQAVVSNLAPKPGLVYCDLTLGAAGHFMAMAQRLVPAGVMVGVDRDAQAIEQARAKLEAVSLERVEMHLVHGNFGEIGEIMARLELKQADRVLIDLGLSSDQLAALGRGFSFLRDERLDMRQDQRQSLTAAQIVNEYSAAELTRVIKEYGEERRTGVIVQAILERRRRRPIERTGELAELIAQATGAHRGRIHPATRTFQALRMEVNDEEGQLKRCLPQLAELLSIGGRLAIITFHSVEDRIVKGSLKPFGRRGGRGDWQVVRLGRVIRPDAAEIRANPRSRSAKLRVYHKVRVEKANVG